MALNPHPLNTERLSTERLGTEPLGTGSPVAVDVSRPPLVRATLASPATGNRLERSMVDALSAALERAERTPGAGVFVLAAEGDTFCAGMSLDELAGVGWRPRLAAVQALLARLAASPLVTVAVADGAALGGGVGLAAACDQVVAGPRASFRMTEVLLGLVPAVILPVVARRVGPHRAFDLALTARRVSPARAVSIGLADRWSAEPARELRQLLVGLRAADPGAVRALKRYRAELSTGPAGRHDQPTGEPVEPYDQPADRWEEPAARVLAERLADPRTRRRLADLRRQGLLP